MPVLRIPTPLRAYTNGQSDVTVNGSNISEALADLTTQYPTIKPHLFNEGGDLRPFVNLFVGENNIKDLQGVNTPIKDGEKIKFTYLKQPNPFKDYVVSFSNRLPVEFELQNYIDYETQFEKTFLDPIKIVLDCIGWTTEKTNSLFD